MNVIHTGTDCFAVPLSLQARISVYKLTVSPRVASPRVVFVAVVYSKGRSALFRALSIEW